MERLIAAVVQLTSTEDVPKNLSRAYELVSRAAARGAGFIALPENFAFLSENEQKPPAEEISHFGPILEFGQKTAREKAVYLLLGSLPERDKNEERVYNTSVLFGPDGEIVSLYRKIHLFDVMVSGKTYRESQR